MKILLVGEYSNLHNSLKKGLQQLGHQVTIIGLSDGFKKYPIDILIKRKFQEGWLKKIKNGVYKLLNIDLTSLDVKKQIFKHQNLLSGYDVVQFINENPFLCVPNIEMDIFNFIISKSRNIFLLSCGTDYISVKYAFDKKFRYSILTPYFEEKTALKDDYSLKYLTKPYQKLHNHIFKNIKGVLASDLDYHIPLKNHSQYLGMVANPINIDKLEYIPLQIEDKIIIFHGINNKNYYKKGNDIFEAALTIISKKHSDKVDIITTRSLPYKQYIEIYNSCHILLDQVYAYDQGYNALEAMAKGKVVFTGAEKEWLDYYNLQEDTVAINALPNAEAIAKKLSWLIENPNKIIEISQNAKAFIEKEHHYKNCAQLYLDKWESTIN